MEEEEEGGVQRMEERGRDGGRRECQGGGGGVKAHTQERGDPCTNLVRAEKNQVAKWKTKQPGFSLKDKKSEFSVKLEPRSRSSYQTS